MTSSLRNSIHRRNHKERSQLAHRSKLGLLEKHADYVKRARDYHSKQNRLTRLKQKAAERNKDEFYFSMQNEKTKRGVHIKDRGNVALPTDIVQVLKTQDENYIRTMRAAGLKKIDKLKSQLTSLADLIKPATLRDDAQDNWNDEEFQLLRQAGIISGSTRTKKGGQNPKHIVFVDGAEEAQVYISRNERSLTEETDNKMAVAVEDNEDDTKPEQRGRRRLLTELAARLARDKQLRYAQRELEMQRLMMGKGGRKKLRGAEKVEGGSEDEDEDEDEIDARKGKVPARKNRVDDDTYKPRVYKWRLERKR